MAWAYSDYPAVTDATARLARLRLHISEVQAEIGADVGYEGKSRQHAALVAYLGTLKSEEKAVSKLAYGASSGFTRGRCL